ncbi:DUF2750 domain-containing protein [Terrimonas sp. NA20]|uniref:DUF2750 domain-containing protein n=1 Tax=Terrimonas ginsenosidimutans TaxID=2908004 RepID=A0ABS9KM93_9BACT|nr:DUF2750 domain-containing protein [Terrimonas ginsenosidimutans]MCG2613445.1 DUF2750 domain-containing protein [Terrimonas ginsenosidimutans]
MYISPQEMEHVSKLTPFARYEYFIKRVANFGEMYALRRDEEWLLAELDGHKLFPLWSAEDFASKNAYGDWVDYKPVSIELDVFNEEIIPLISSSEYLINVFSVNQTSGFVVTHEEFMRDLSEELEKYD